MTLLEVMVMILVLSITLTAMFTTLIQGINLQRLIQQRVQATNIAREGIEGVVNLRNTNWLRFTSNRTNCWNVKDYNANCITTKPTTTNTLSGPNLLFRKNGAWWLSGTTQFDESQWGDSMDRFRIYIDDNGWYTSTGTFTELCNASRRTGCKSIFSREIQITSLSDDALEVTAIVRWRDASPRKVTLTEIIRNWKKNYDK
ncbi:hypothetical protein CSB09_04395 [Candidatus Gracilibacteria bacterium]|nr:MAG: hypothetical protein CSB09_04395 [Candidatus Gracilibacteria bacterium]